MRLVGRIADDLVGGTGVYVLAELLEHLDGGADLAVIGGRIISCPQFDGAI